MSDAPEERTWPELAEVIAGKALDALHRLMWRVSEGELSPETGAVALKMALECVSGVLPREPTELFWESIAELERQSEPETMNNGLKPGWLAEELENLRLGR